MAGDDRRLIDEQIAYYRARAAEYDATSMPEGDPFAAHVEAIRTHSGRSADGGGCSRSRPAPANGRVCW